MGIKLVLRHDTVKVCVTLVGLHSAGDGRRRLVSRHSVQQVRHVNNDKKKRGSEAQALTSRGSQRGPMPRSRRELRVPDCKRVELDQRAEQRVVCAPTICLQ